VTRSMRTPRCSASWRWPSPPPEPQLQHAALRLTAGRWETAPLPAPDGSGTFVVALDLRAHDVVIETSNGANQSLPLGSDRAVGAVTRDVLEALNSLVGPVAIDRPAMYPADVGPVNL